jgi:hypothetical protein
MASYLSNRSPPLKGRGTGRNDQSMGSKVIASQSSFYLSMTSLPDFSTRILPTEAAPKPASTINSGAVRRSLREARVEDLTFAQTATMVAATR